MISDYAMAIEPLGKHRAEAVMVNQGYHSGKIVQHFDANFPCRTAKTQADESHSNDHLSITLAHSCCKSISVRATHNRLAVRMPDKDPINSLFRQAT